MFAGNHGVAAQGVSVFPPEVTVCATSSTGVRRSTSSAASPTPTRDFTQGAASGTLLALLGIDKWRIPAPVKHGDTIHMEQTVLEKKPTTKPGRGIVVFQRQIKNQAGTVVQEMEATIMHRCRDS